MVKDDHEDVREGQLPGPGRKHFAALEFKGVKLVLFHPLVRGEKA